VTSNDKDCCIIVGGGQAGEEAAVRLRQEGYPGRIHLLGEEATPPYHRPPLTKAYLKGTADTAELALRPADLYAELEIVVETGTRVERIDVCRQELELSNGGTTSYDKLVLATGSRPRHLNLPGGELSQIKYVRTAEDARSVRSSLGRGRRCAVIGGGYLGLEVAAVAARMGTAVTVLEAAGSVLTRVTGAEVAAHMSRVHRSEGVSIVCEVSVEGFEPSAEGGVVVVCTDGLHLADVVVVAVGVIPNVELAAGAGVAMGDGILVDECCRTSNPAVFAAGDCTDRPVTPLSRRARLESVHNAVEQGRGAAAAICGQERPCRQMPWFWSDQYEQKLQTVGLPTRTHQTFVRGEVDRGSFSVLYTNDIGAIEAVDAINAPRTFAQARALFAKHGKASSLPDMEEWDAVVK
jgi:3-phenylpropionate/trans-cinnamate dioxygenase ferredoxin reductase subunit